MPSFEEDTSLRPGWAKTTLLPLLQKHEICFRGPSIMAKGRGGEMEYFKNPSGPHLMRKNMKYVSDFSIFCWCCNPQQVPLLTSWKVPFCQQHGSGNVIYLVMLQLILKCYTCIYFFVLTNKPYLNQLSFTLYNKRIRCKNIWLNIIFSAEISLRKRSKTWETELMITTCFLTNFAPILPFLLKLFWLVTNKSNIYEIM